MSNSKPEIQCSFAPWFLDISYIYQTEEIRHNGIVTHLYERFPAIELYMKIMAINRGTGRTIDRRAIGAKIIQNHFDYMRDILKNTAYLIDERRRRNWRWTMLSIYSNRMRGRKSK